MYNGSDVGKAIGSTIANFTIVWVGFRPLISIIGLLYCLLILVNMCKFNLSFMFAKLSIDCGHRFRDATRIDRVVP